MVTIIQSIHSHKFNTLLTYYFLEVDKQTNLLSRINIENLIKTRPAINQTTACAPKKKVSMSESIRMHIRGLSPP